MYRTAVAPRARPGREPANVGYSMAKLVKYNTMVSAENPSRTTICAAAGRSKNRDAT